MNIELKEFQETAVGRLYRHAGAASGAVADELSAIVLSAPTGSGKTVVATALVERIAAGDEETTGDPNAVFLWLTDQPELNEQTRKKFEANSDILGSAKLVTLDVSFGQSRLAPGHVYFLNTQKLGRGSLFVRKGDKRPQTIWEILANTIRAAPGSFWLVIDEAHRGMGVSQRERDEARTIVQKFIFGSEEDALPAVPLILGISATPQRFDELLAGTERTRRAIEIKPDDVRESGLLKDLVTVSHPTEEQPSDVTLLRAAAAELRLFREAWAEYAAAETTRRVEPLLVVQIEDARQGSKEISRTALDEVISAIEAELGPLGEDEIAHALQEGHAVTIGERTIRYVAPSDIEQESKLRVVLFKSSLNTGWDCPRAEVMMSFRRAVDLTHIAQLVGRMVRTPLARRVSTNELLNSVSLYLPHYDEESLAEVVGYLASPDPELGIGTDVRLRDETLELALNPELAAAAALANTLPTYSIERIAKTTNVKRLLRLGRELAYDKLDKDALDRYRATLLAVLDVEREKRKGTKQFKDALAAAGKLDIRRVGVTYGEEGDLVVEETQLDVALENIHDLYTRVGRLLGEGLHAAYVKRRVERGKESKGKRPTLAAVKQELYALVQIEDVRRALETTAGTQLAAAFTKHGPAVRKLADERRQRYRRLQKQARAPE
ncbi:MAG: DEAD/DEAH box helicase, partial [Acidimicrobiia bacterium]